MRQSIVLDSPMDTFTLALRAVRLYLLIVGADSTYNRRTATIKFDGFCEAVDALGLAMTPAHFHLTVADAIRAADPRPEIRITGSNDDARAWDEVVARDVIKRLEEW